MKQVAVTLLVLVALVQFMAMPSEAAITCGQVSSFLSPCMTYLQSGGGNPPTNCCSGVRSLSSMLGNRPDRQAACNCIKAAASHYPNIKPDAASNLPGKCGVPLNVPISATTNCNTIP